MGVFNFAVRQQRTHYALSQSLSLKTILSSFTLNVLLDFTTRSFTKLAMPVEIIKTLV